MMPAAGMRQYSLLDRSGGDWFFTLVGARICNCKCGYPTLGMLTQGTRMGGTAGLRDRDDG
jgi:hypothetical protein